MDISKASNFERFIFDLVGRDANKVRELWTSVDRGGAFDLSGTSWFAGIADHGFVSGSSTHADRLVTIRRVFERHELMIDPHTADGIKVGLDHREAGVPLVCLETALPAKFAETIGEALGRAPLRPPGFEHIEDLPQRSVVIEPDVQAVKDFIVRHVAT